MTSHLRRVDTFESISGARAELASAQEKVTACQGELQQLQETLWGERRAPAWWLEHPNELRYATEAAGASANAASVLTSVMNSLAPSGSGRIGWHYGILRMSATTEDVPGVSTFAAHLWGAGFHLISLDVDGYRYTIQNHSVWQNVDNGDTGTLAQLHGRARRALTS